MRTNILLFVNKIFLLIINKKCQLTLLDRDWANVAHVIFDIDKLWSLYLPNLLLVFRRKATEEVEPPHEQLTFIRIIEQTTPLARVVLIRIVDRKALIEISDGTDFAIAVVENLSDFPSVRFETSTSISTFYKMAVCYLRTFAAVDFV